MMFSVTRRLAIAIALLAFAATLGGSAARATTSTPEATDPCSAPPAGTPATGQSATGMHMGQEFDLMFIDMMIPHHESAIAMARVALARAEHEEIRTLAQEIIAGQQPVFLNFEDPHDMLERWQHAEEIATRNQRSSSDSPTVTR